MNSNGIPLKGVVTETNPLEIEDVEKTSATI
jgi:hypothetical protein